MGFAKGVAFFGVVLLGLGLFATVFYQSGLLQKIQQENSALAMQVSSSSGVKDPEPGEKDKSKGPLSNPNGDTVIAIIQHYRPLENKILHALDQGTFEGGF